MMKKIFFAGLLSAIVFAVSPFSAPLASAQALPSTSSIGTMSDEQLVTLLTQLIQIVQQLQAQISSQRGGQTNGNSTGDSAVADTHTNGEWCYNFNQNLKIGSEGQVVMFLHEALRREGLVSSPQSVQDLFDERIASAVTAFQEKYASEILTPNGLSNGTGFLGASTRAKLNQLYGCSGNNNQPSSVPTVSLSASPTSVVSDGKVGTATLYWSSTNANYCNFEKGNLSTSGSMPVTFYSTATYTMSCTGSGGTGVSNPVTITYQLTGQPPVTTQPSITVLSPNGGENWTIGEKRTVSWSTNGITGTYAAIYLAPADDLSKAVIYDQPFLSVGSQTVTVRNPNEFISYSPLFASSNKFKIIICAGANYTYPNCSYSDSSDSYFTITSSASTAQPSITLGGSQNYNSLSFVPGQTFQIAWTIGGLTLQQSTGSGVQLQLLDNNKNLVGSNLQPPTGIICLVCASSNASGYYNWIIPSGLTTGQYYIKAMTVGGTSPYNVETTSVMPINITVPTSSNTNDQINNMASTLEGLRQILESLKKM